MKLRKASVEDSELIRKMQTEAFAELLAKYQDYDTNPGNESAEKIRLKIQQPFTCFYLIEQGEEVVGAIRIVDMKDGSRKRISPLFIMPAHRNKGYAQSAIREAERLHGQDNWKLATILQEDGNCYLYEKMGYQKTGRTEIINDRMTIVHYEKD